MATDAAPQKHLLTLIRDVASERSQGERRVSDFKNRIADLESETLTATAELELAKRAKELAEQQLKGVQVQLSMTDATVAAQQARILMIHEEIGKTGAELTEVKKVEGVERDEFIKKMLEYNSEIRQFRDTLPAFWKQYDADASSENVKALDTDALNLQDDLKGLKDEIASVTILLQKVEDEYKKELHDHDEAHKELSNEERRVFLVEAVMEETRQLQELSRQTSELEKEYASLGEELQKSYTCPRCQLNNMEDMEEATEPDVMKD